MSARRSLGKPLAGAAATAARIRPSSAIDRNGADRVLVATVEQAPIRGSADSDARDHDPWRPRIDSFTRRLREAPLDGWLNVTQRLT